MAELEKQLTSSYFFCHKLI